MLFWADVPWEERLQLFSTSHILFLLSVIFVVGLFVYKLDWVRDHWKQVRIVMLVISGIQFIVFYTWSFTELGFSLEAGLPIHLCRLSTILGLYFLMTEDRRVFHALYFMSAFAIVAIVYPSNVHPLYTHVVGYTFQISHIMILLVWIVGVFLYGYRPTYRILNTAILVFFFVELFVWRFNYWVGDGEYLYLRSDVNRPFLTSWPDLAWIAFTIGLSYLIMLGMTKAMVNNINHRYALSVIPVRRGEQETNEAILNKV
jgi:hypothetical integral membrane protein (TIGR02206 family)